MLMQKKMTVIKNKNKQLNKQMNRYKDKDKNQ